MLLRRFSKKALCLKYGSGSSTQPRKTASLHVDSCRHPTWERWWQAASMTIGTTQQRQPNRIARGSSLFGDPTTKDLANLNLQLRLCKCVTVFCDLFCLGDPNCNIRAASITGTTLR